jgi:polar amino acid transport system substrate-binding protein
MRCKKLFSFLLAIVCLLSISSCSTQKPAFKSIAELKTATFAVPTGTIADQLVRSKLPAAKFIYFHTAAECCTAVQNGKADAAAYDEPVLRNLAAKMTGLTLLAEMITNDNYGFAVNQNRPDLKKAIDDTVAELKANGTYEEMRKRWLPDKGNPGPMPAIELSGANGSLKFGTAAVVEPFTYVAADKSVIGFDIELAARICQKLGLKLEIVNMYFGQMIPALTAGQVDMIGACLTINSERSKTVLFSEPYYQGGIAAIVKK